MAKQQNRTIRLVHLNNKSRQGTYVYIKEKGRPDRYYKVKDNTPIDPYIKYYKAKYIDKDQTIKLTKTLDEGKTQAKKYIQKISKHPTLDQSMGKGITIAKTTNALTATNRTIKNANQKIVKPLLKDKDLLKIISQNENLKKVKHRFENRIQIKNKEGKTLATATIFNKTPEDTIKLLQRTTIQNETVTGSNYELKEKLEKTGFIGYQHITNGTIHNIEIISIFRKGK